MGNRNLRFFFLVAVYSIFLLQGSGCSGPAINEDDPASIYNAAEEDIEDGRYIMAHEKLQKVKNKFPYSKYSAMSRLRIADVYFMQEKFFEAASAYEAFRDLHPKHEQTPYAQYRVGESYFQDIPSQIARDLSSADHALRAFQTFVVQFPASELATKAKERISEIRNVLAEKELYIANFYNKRDFPESAKPRYQKIVTKYPETESAAEAKEKLQSLEGSK